MRIVLTGASGFIGRHVAAAFAARGDEVTPLARAQADDEADLRALLTSRSPDAVVHLAWPCTVGDYLTSAANDAGVRLAERLAVAAIAAGVPHLLAVGTGLEHVPTVRALPYVRAKSAARHAVAAACEGTQMRHTWARLFHVYGPGEHPSRLVPSVVSALRRGQDVLLSDGAQLRDPIHVEDVARALLALVGTAAPHVGCVDVGCGVPVSLARFVEAIADRMGAPHALLRFGARPRGAHDVDALVADVRDLRSAGWSPRFGSTLEGLGYIEAEQ